ncbi:MAG TPA: cytochrome c [Nannocystaceae bacterium]|nr:cytochrome c [Nannocystaceae bacterium]
MTTRWLSALLLLCAVACESAPRFTAPMKLGGVEIPAEILDQGARVYEIRCASCHGPEGAGDGSAGRTLPKPPRSFQLAQFQYKSTPGDELPTDADLEATIRNGRIDEGMPAWNTLSESDRHAVIQYIKTFSPRWKG